MPRHDMRSDVTCEPVINPVAIGTTGTGQTGAVIDTRGFETCTFTIHYGAITATGAVFTPAVLSGAATGSLTTASTDELIGTIAGAVLAAGARVDGSTENVVKTIGYRGSSRYVRLDVSSTATAGTIISAAAILGGAHRKPTDQV